MNSKDRRLTAHSAVLQALYWMAFCVVFNYAVVFLLGKGLENQQIGLLLALANVAAVGLQSSSGAWADRRPPGAARGLFLAGAAVVASLLAAIAFLPENRGVLAVVYGGMLAVTMMMQPLLNAMIFEHINAGRQIHFGFTRGIGSVAFAGLSLALGAGIRGGNITLLPVVGAILFAAMTATVWLYPVGVHAKGPNVEREAAGGVREMMTRYQRFVPFLLGLACLYVFHTLTNSYLVQIIENVGGEAGDLGLSLTIAAVCELPAMMGFGFLAARFKSGDLLKAAGVFYVLRSLAFLFSSSTAMISATQLLQAGSFALYAPAVVYYINQRMRAEDRVKGQTLIVGANVLGGVAGSLSGGWLLDHASVQAMLWLGVGAAIAGCLLLFYSVRSEARLTGDRCAALGGEGA